MSTNDSHPNILILIHDLNIGGVGTSLINVTKLLLNSGCNITIKTTSKEVSQQLIGRIDRRIKLEICEQKRFPILEKMLFFKNFYEPGMWTRRTKPKRVYRHFVHKQERTQYDVEIAFYYGKPVKAISGSTNTKSRKVMWIRLGFMDDTYYPGFSSKEAAIEGYSSFDRIIGVSEDVCDNFIRFTGVNAQKVVAIHNYLDKEKIDRCLLEQCDLQKSVFTISYVCRLVPVKNVLALVRVVERLQKEGIECGCWLVGDGPLRAEVEEYIRQHRVLNVRITGYQQNPHKYVKASDLYVSTSLMQGYPNTIADSMYIGTPIVSTRCVGAPNILRNGKYGILVDFDQDSIYQGVKKMITDRAVYAHYKNILSEFDFVNEAEKISQQLVDAILGE